MDKMKEWMVGPPIYMDVQNKIDDLRGVLKEIYNLCHFDYDKMPESLRRDIFAAVLELADKGLDIK